MGTVTAQLVRAEWHQLPREHGLYLCLGGGGREGSSEEETFLWSLQGQGGQ